MPPYFRMPVGTYNPHSLGVNYIAISIKTSTTLGSNAGLNVFMAETRKRVRSCFCPTPRFNPKSYLDHAIQIWIFWENKSC